MSVLARLRGLPTALTAPRHAEPPSATGASEKPRGTATSCTFAVTFTFEDPELGVLTGLVTGSVNGFCTPLG